MTDFTVPTSGQIHGLDHWIPAFAGMTGGSGNGGSIEGMTGP